MSENFLQDMLKSTPAPSQEPGKRIMPNFLHRFIGSSGYYRDQHECEIHEHEEFLLFYFKTQRDPYRFSGTLAAFLAAEDPVMHRQGPIFFPPGP